MPEPYTDQLSDQFRYTIDQPSTMNRLTPREQEVLRLIADGKSTKELAALLRISYKTASCHRQRIMSKLYVHNTATLVRSAIRLGLVPL